jgi:hypothetical protein
MRRQGMDQDEQNDLRAYRRLRNYYRENFERGDSFEMFQVWIEEMAARDGEIVLDEAEEEEWT